MTGRWRRGACSAALAAATAMAVLLGSAAPVAAAPGPPDYPQWWFDTWDVPALWAGGARGQGITIAEIDTGVNSSVPELADKVLVGKDFGDPTSDGRTDQDLDAFGHGTAMASLMVAEPRFLTGNITGLAPDARILPVAVPLIGTATEGSPNGGLYEAIRWAADSGAKIISMSLGQERDPASDAVPCPQIEQDAITYAISKGAIVVAGSGNEGEAGSPVADPAVCIGVVAVGAVDRGNEVAAFSSRHPYLTVAAPGVDIPTLSRIFGRAYIGQGTSQATALTSAVLAMVWSKHPELTNHQVVARLLATLDRRTPTADPAYGFGIVNAANAVNAPVPLDAPNPVLDAIAPFLDRVADEAAVVDVPPEPATTTELEPAELVVAARPSVLTPPVLGGIALGALGALSLMALLALGIVRRRRYAQAAGAHSALPGDESPAAGSAAESADPG